MPSLTSTVTSISAVMLGLGTTALMSTGQQSAMAVESAANAVSAVFDSVPDTVPDSTPTTLPEPSTTASLPSTTTSLPSQSTTTTVVNGLPSATTTTPPVESIVPLPRLPTTGATWQSIVILALLVVVLGRIAVLIARRVKVIRSQ